MNYDDLTNEQKEIWDIAHEQGYNEGFDSGQDFGWDEAVSHFDNEDDDYESFSQGFEKGVLAERQRVQDVLQMMFEAAINMGQGNKAVQYKNMMDLLRPVDIKEYSDEDF